MLYFTRAELAERWKMSVRSVDRLRLRGKLAWTDFSNGSGLKPTVRFRLDQVEAYETKTTVPEYQAKS